jgi:predicted dehydrogenase
MSAVQKKPIRVAIIGCGKIGSKWDELAKPGEQAKSHAGAFAQNSNARIVCLMDTDLARAQQAAEFWKAEKATDQLKDLIASEPDIVCLATPEYHRVAYLDGLNALKNLVIVSEKPLAANRNEADQILEIQKKHPDWKWSVNFIRRYTDGFRKLRSLIESNELGPLKSVHCWYGKGFRNSASHGMDLLDFLFSMKATTVQVFGSVTDDRVKTDPTLEFRLEYKNSEDLLVPVHFMPTNHNDFFLFEMTMVFKQGRVQISDLGHQIEIFTVKEDGRYPDYRTLEKKHHWNDGLKLFFENMAVEAVALAQENITIQSVSGLESAYRNMQILDAIERSRNMSGQKIEIQ